MGISRQEHCRVLVLVETKGKEIASVTFEIISAGKKIANELRGILCAVVLGDEVSDVSWKIASFVDEVYSLDLPVFGRFQAEIYVSAVEQLCQNVNPDAVLMSHSIANLDLAPRLAHKMGVQVITDCIQLTVEPETTYLLCTKPVYGAKVFSTFELEKKPYIATLRPKAMDPSGPNPDRGKVIQFNPVIDKSSVRVELIEIKSEDNISLDNADVIVAGGRGIRDVEGLKELQELGKTLKKCFNKVELGASRPLVDSGLVPSFRQIGLTGQKVAPGLYIAIGISGSLQHLTGMLCSKKIIAINNNPKAPIFEVAHYGLVGNYEDVVPAFRKKIEELL